MKKLDGALIFELQTNQDAELGRHRLSETTLREIETLRSQELNRPYRIPETQRERIKARDNLYG